MIAHRIDWQRGGSRIAFADSHGAPSHPYTQRSSSCSPTRYAIVALRPRMCRTLRSDKELPLRAQVRGRDVHFWTPPAQIRTSPIRASGSYLGCVTAKRRSGAFRTRSSAWVTRARP